MPVPLQGYIRNCIFVSLPEAQEQNIVACESPVPEVTDSRAPGSCNLGLREAPVIMD